MMLAIEGRTLLGVCVHEEHDALAGAWETAARGLLDREFVEQVTKRILEQKPAKKLRAA